MQYNSKDSKYKDAYRIVILAGWLVMFAGMSLPALGQGPYGLTWKQVVGTVGESVGGDVGSEYSLSGTIRNVDPQTNGEIDYYVNTISTGPTWPVASSSKLLMVTDFNFDWHVNIDDLLIFVGHWMERGCSESNAWCGGADFDHSHDVGISDFFVLVENWGNVAVFTLYSFPLDDNPGWTTEGQWAFGQPSGGGGSEHGNPDPSSGDTGINVYGVNLDGDYEHTVTGGPYCLTTGPFDCSEYENIYIKFARWLNTDEPDYVASKMEVSVNSSDWDVVWEHSDSSEIADDNWQTVEYSLGGTADNQETIYIRWCYEIVSGSQAWPYSGWNIDDIELLGNPSI